MANVTPIDVEPIDTQSVMAFVNRDGEQHALRRVKVPVYPSSPQGQELRDRRVAHRTSLADAAQWLGISVSDLSAIEHGAKTLSLDDWRTAFRALG